jgi:hypothetical protein
LEGFFANVQIHVGKRAEHQSVKGEATIIFSATSNVPRSEALRATRRARGHSRQDALFTAQALGAGEWATPAVALARLAVDRCFDISHVYRMIVGSQLLQLSARYITARAFMSIQTPD